MAKGEREPIPRLSIALTEEQYKALYDLIPWGVKNQLFSIIIDDLIRLMQEQGAEMVLAAIFSKQLKLKDFTLKGKE